MKEFLTSCLKCFENSLHKSFLSRERGGGSTDTNDFHVDNFRNFLLGTLRPLIEANGRHLVAHHSLDGAGDYWHQLGLGESLLERGGSGVIQRLRELGTGWLSAPSRGCDVTQIIDVQRVQRKFLLILLHGYFQPHSSRDILFVQF